MSSFVYGTEYKLQGKWVAKDKDMADFGGERQSIEVDNPTAPKISYETAGEEYYPQTLYSWHEEQLNWEIENEIFTLHVLSGPGKLERPYQKYVTIKNQKTNSFKRYKLVEITEEEYEDTKEWYKSVEDKIWCEDSQWDNLPTKDRIDNIDIELLSADENGFIINGTSLYGYDESIGGPIVNIPNGIKRIKSRAFLNCKSITNVYIPDSVSSIGEGCFDGCKNLVGVRLPEGLTKISDRMFENCESLKEINLPNTVTSIGCNSFASCKSLEEVVMPSSLTTIVDRAFQCATSLKKITFNSGLQKIEWYAFGNCPALTELYIPASVTEIGNNAFEGCSSIERIVVEEGNEAYYSENNCLICEESKLLILACNDSVIPDDGSVERIHDNAFSNCKRMENIVVPETIKGISRYAFSGCSSLKSIQLPKSLPYGYGEQLFEDCSSLEYFEIPDWMKKISSGMFRGCESLKEIKIPNSVTIIDSGAFSGCKSLTGLVIPKSVTRIGSDWSAFGIGDFIDGCTSLSTLEVEEGNPVYHSKDNCIIKTKTNTLLAISENGVIPDDGSVTVIGDKAFCACENISEISLPDCITKIGRDAFSKVKSLKKINIPKSVNDIGRDAFFESIKGHSPDLMEEENGVYYVGNWAVGIARRQLPRPDSDDLFSLFAPTSEEALPESGAITIREGTVGICEASFSNSRIQAISLPSSLKYICDSAFAYCNNFKTISIPESVEKIGDSAFNACYGLEMVVLQEGLISIGNSAFNCCEKLKSVTIPNTVNSIGRGAFRFCKGLENLVIPDVEIEIGYDAFNYCGNIPSIDIPERIMKSLTLSSTDEDEETNYYEGEADDCGGKADGIEGMEFNKSLNVDDLIF